MKIRPLALANISAIKQKWAKLAVMIIIEWQGHMQWLKWNLKISGSKNSFLCSDINEGKVPWKLINELVYLNESIISLKNI